MVGQLGAPALVTEEEDGPMHNLFTPPVGMQSRKLLGLTDSIERVGSLTPQRRSAQ